MKKLVFVLPGVTGGGAEKFVLNLYRAMELYQNCECHIVSLSRNIAHELAPGLRIHYLDEASKVSKKGLGRLTYRRKLATIIDDYIDRSFGNGCVVLANMMHSDKATSLSRHNVFHVIHSAYSHSLLEGKSATSQFFIKRNINNIYGNHPLIFVSQGAYDSFCAHFKTETNKFVIYNPVLPEEIRSLGNAETEDTIGDYIIHVGRFNRAKRHDRLLKAFADVESNIKLLLLGDGKLANSIKAKVADLGLDKRVVFLGFRQNPYPYIRQAKALVLSSDFEGLPTAVLEAISLGIPVVTTDCPGGIREIIDHPSPSLVPLGDDAALTAAITDALRHPEKYRTPLADKFSAKVVAERYAELFD